MAFMILLKLAESKDDVLILNFACFDERECERERKELLPVES